MKESKLRLTGTSHIESDLWMDSCQKQPAENFPYGEEHPTGISKYYRYTRDVAGQSTAEWSSVTTLSICIRCLI